MFDLIAVVLLVYYGFRVALHFFDSVRIAALATGGTVVLVVIASVAIGWIRALFAGPLPAPQPSHLTVLSANLGYASRATPPPSAIVVETSARVYLVSDVDPLMHVILGAPETNIASVCDRLKPSILQLYVTSDAMASIGRVGKHEALHVVLPVGAVATPGASLAGVESITAYTDDGYVGSVCPWQASDLTVMS